MKVNWPLMGAAWLLPPRTLALQGTRNEIFSNDIHEHPRDGICMEKEKRCRAWLNST